MLVLIKVNVLNCETVKKTLSLQICTGSCGREFKLSQCPTSWPQRNKQTGESPNQFDFLLLLFFSYKGNNKIAE